MGEVVTCHFSWNRHGIAFLPSLLPEDFQILCPSFELAMAEQATEYYELSELPQVVFYAMLLNEAERLGVLQGQALQSLELALTELHWSDILRHATERGSRAGRGSRVDDREYEIIVGKPEVHTHVPSKHCLLYIMSSSCSSSGDVPEGLVGPQVEGRHPQFSNLPAFIDGRVVAGIPEKNRYREPKKIPYDVPLFEPGTPSWSSCKYFSTPSILNPEVEVTYPWEITITNYMPDFQVRRMAKTKSIPRIRSPDELLAESTQGNPYSAPPQSNPEAEVASTSSSASSGTSSSDSSSRHPPEAHPQRGCLQALPPPKHHWDRANPQDGPGSHFPHPKVVTKLKRSSLAKQYLFPTEYSFVISEAEATVNKPIAKCIAVYRVTLNYGPHFPLHPVIREILNMHELAPAQVVPTSWHNIYSFIATCELCGLTCSARTFDLIHTIQRAPKETGDLGWLGGRPLTGMRESPCGTLFGEPTADEWRTARYFQFYIRENDKPRPVPKFMAQAIESVKGPRRGGASLVIGSNQARVRLTVFETEDATLEQVAANVECKREEERQRLVTQQAKKEPSLIPRGKRPAVSLPVRKKQKIEEQPGEAMASAPSQVGEARAERLTPHRLGRRSSGEYTPARQEHLAPLKTIGAATPAASGASPLAPRPSANFIKVDPTVRLSLVQGIVKSWDLATRGASDPPKVVLTFASEFQDDCYFEAYLHFVDERERATAEGRDPEEVKFIPPSSEGEVARDEATNPLEPEAGASEEEEHEDGGELDVWSPPLVFSPPLLCFVCVCFVFCFCFGCKELYSFYY
ncbi:hypothetical protein Cgig2_026559 [Carnegiea gigantea]|uniref:Uncharacterized protein n=1 Tax=Carnegiea gigantea TaxID=171969 RepID=A0A9Q1Q5B1_9CARY|nr:hypothetical protein Cgig2_026559 [Carnegiea gigantea]